jgi:predicted phosphodiesterase
MLGIVRGNLKNESGDVEVFGTVHGKVITKNGYTYVNPGSKVGSIESAVPVKETVYT